MSNNLKGKGSFQRFTNSAIPATPGETRTTENQVTWEHGNGQSKTWLALLSVSMQVEPELMSADMHCAHLQAGQLALCTLLEPQCRGQGCSTEVTQPVQAWHPADPFIQFLPQQLQPAQNSNQSVTHASLLQLLLSYTQFLINSGIFFISFNFWQVNNFQEFGPSGLGNSNHNEKKTLKILFLPI